MRRYTEERELTVVVAVDLSASQSFGTAERLKRLGLQVGKPVTAIFKASSVIVGTAD